ncbi:hypothetical protein BGX34_007731, partial [Mortierella sp. NVP85]
MSRADSILIDLASNSGSESAFSSSFESSHQDLAQLQVAQLQASGETSFDTEASKDLFEAMEPHLRLPTSTHMADNDDNRDDYLMPSPPASCCGFIEKNPTLTTLHNSYVEQGHFHGSDIELPNLKHLTLDTKTVNK